jgi:trigger factor
MPVTQTGADGLKREFRIVVPNDEVERQITSRLDELGRTIRVPGFRPGKVPPQLLRRRYGPTVRGQVLESAVQDSTAEAIREHNLRPALPPRVDIVSFDEGADLEYRMSVELLPDIPEPSFADLGVERLIVEVPDADVDKAVERIAEQQRKSEPVERPAESGDILVVDIDGRAEDREIPGASGKDRQIVLGSGHFLPGFEEQLIGAAAGEHRAVKVTFPGDYGAADLASKEAVFEVDVKEVRQRAPLVIDDELGKSVGLQSLAELRQEMQERMRQEYAGAARLRLKRALLDRLAERYDFPVPIGMVDIEFETMWAAHQAAPSPGEATDAAAVAGEAATAAEAAVAGEAATAGEAAAGDAGETAAAGEAAADGAAAAPDAAEATDAAERAEYREIAERRVRLGLLLAEVGRNNNITVTQEELNQAIIREARRHFGHERQVLDFYRQHPEAVARLRGPIFEDKVVDFIIELAKPEERHVTPQELLAMPEPEEPAPAQAEAPGENAALVGEPS